MLKTILFRIPQELAKELHVELQFRGMTGQDFVSALIWDKLREVKESQEYIKQENFKGQTRHDLELELFKNVRVKKKESSRRNLSPRG